MAAVTARNYADMVRPFVASRSDAAGELDLRALVAGDVLAFVLAECPHRRPGSAKLLVTALRSLLGYLHVEGVIARPLAPVVPSVAGWRLAGLPRGLGAEQVTALLASCDLETAVGVRDFAILELLVRLGMRRGEVRSLALDDIDWRCGRDYGARQRQPTRAVAAAGRCWQRARRLSAPGATRERGGPGGVRAREGAASRAERRRHQPGRDRGRPPCRFWSRERAPAQAHDRDRTVALRRAAGGDRAAARHRSQQTTAIYAKVDRERLRALARPWPSLGGVS